jgi:hypothetical protein
MPVLYDDVLQFILEGWSPLLVCSRMKLDITFDYTCHVNTSLWTCTSDLS